MRTFTAVVAGLLMISSAQAVTLWDWTMTVGAGTENGTFTTDDGVVNGTGMRYTVSQATIQSSDNGATAGPQTLTIGQPTIDFTIDGGVATQFRRANGAVSNGFNLTGTAFGAYTIPLWIFAVGFSEVGDDVDSNPQSFASATPVITQQAPTAVPVPMSGALLVMGLLALATVAPRRGRHA